MSDLRELYQELIIDHGRKPRNFGVLESADYVQEGFNPLCGDRLTLYVKMSNDKISDVCFVGEGCAISMASASLMTGLLKNKTLAEMQEIFTLFHQLVTGKGNVDSEKLGKLVVLGGVAEYPARVKCATLCWHTVLEALEINKKELSCLNP